MKLSQALGVTEPGIISCVGAGGKTSLLLSLSAEWRQAKEPFLLTTTTKMFFSQVKHLAPVFSQHYEQGEEEVVELLARYGYASWFKMQREEKVDGISPQWIDKLFASRIVPRILVEADGARNKLIKAPGSHEPVIPGLNHLTAGVLNINAVGQPISPEIVHRPEIVQTLLGKAPGDEIEPRDMALLAGHEQGIFRGCIGKKVLVLTGGDNRRTGIGEEVVEYLPQMNRIGLSRCVGVEGFGTQMRPLWVVER